MIKFTKLVRGGSLNNLIKFIWRNLVIFGFLLVLIITLGLFGYGFTQRSKVHAYDDLKVTTINYRKPFKSNGITITVLKRIFDRGEENVTYKLKVVSKNKAQLPMDHLYIADWNLPATSEGIPVNMLSVKSKNKILPNIKVNPGTNFVELTTNLWPQKDHSKINLVFLRYEAKKRRHALYILD